MDGIHMHHTSPPLLGTQANPASVTARIINSEITDDQWAKSHKSCADHNPAQYVHDEIIHLLEESQNWKQALAKSPEHLVFMQEMIALQRGALSSLLSITPLDNDLLERESGLEYIAKELQSVLPESALPTLSQLPKDWQDLIKLEKFHTAQTGFRPASDSAKFVWKWTKHLWHELGHHKKTVIPGLAVAGGLAYMMTGSFGNQQFTLQAKDLTLINCSVDDLFSEEGCTETNPDYFNADWGQSCHSHLTQTFNEPTANFLISIGADSILGQHCTKISTLALDSQNALNFIYTGYNVRFREGIGSPAESIGALSEEQLETFAEVYSDTVDTNLDRIEAFNTVENIALHGAIIVASCAIAFNAAAKGKKPSMRALKSSKTMLSNVFHSVSKNSPLTALGAIAGSSYAGFTNYFWDGGWTNGQLNPDVVWYGAFAAMAGYTIEKSMRYWKRRDHVRANTEHVKTELSILAAQNISPIPAPKLKHKHSPMRHVLPITGTVAAGAALTTLDLQLTGGVHTAQFLGTAIPWGTYLSVNPIEDVTAHYAFAVIGGIAGGAIGGITRILTASGQNLTTKFAAAASAALTAADLYITGGTHVEQTLGTFIPWATNVSTALRDGLIDETLYYSLPAVGALAGSIASSSVFAARNIAEKTLKTSAGAMSRSLDSKILGNIASRAKPLIGEQAAEKVKRLKNKISDYFSKLSQKPQSVTFWEKSAEHDHNHHHHHECGHDHHHGHGHHHHH